MPKYYCLLCEASHPEIKPSITCSSCGRDFCIDSIEQSISVGITGCPYCDQPFEEINLSTRVTFSSEFKKKKPFSSSKMVKRVLKKSRSQEKQTIAIYTFVACITLPFIAIIVLMFLRVFLMFFEIFSRF